MPNKLLYPYWADVTPAILKFEGEPSADGSPVELLTWEGKVNFSESTKKVQDNDGRWITLTGVIHVKGDILKDVPFIRGTANVGGYENKTIVSVKRPRNPDGTINHTRLELI